jgi:hypothetical protein
LFRLLEPNSRFLGHWKISGRGDELAITNLAAARPVHNYVLLSLDFRQRDVPLLRRGCLQ